MPIDGPIAVVGVGLMGGSLGLALQARAGVDEVRGFDPDPNARAAALAHGAITVACDTVRKAVEGARMVFVGAPVSVTAAVARQVLQATGEDCVVSDVGSSKAAVLEALSADERERFIGGHPICGSERGGVDHAREDMFVGATYFLTPSEETRPELYERLHRVVGAIGARPSAIDASAHDRILALVSHLPHVVASALIHQAAATVPHGREALRSAGPSFVDLTRVAGANPPLWADILLSNADAVADAIADQRERLLSVEAAIRAGDREWLHEFISVAADGRVRLRETPQVVDAPWRVLIALANRPGALSQIATALGHAHINIEDMQLRSGAGEEQGFLSLIVSGASVAAEANDVLVALGYAVHTEQVGTDA